MTTKSPAGQMIESVMQGREPCDVVQRKTPIIEDQATQNIADKIGWLNRMTDQAAHRLKRTPIKWGELESDLLIIRDDTIELIAALRKADRK